jgi:hypothetical protein
MEERSENASGTVGSNVRNIFEPPSRWYSKDERPYAQRRAKLTSLRARIYPAQVAATSRDGAASARRSPSLSFRAGRDRETLRIVARERGRFRAGRLDSEAIPRQLVLLAAGLSALLAAMVVGVGVALGLGQTRPEKRINRSPNCRAPVRDRPAAVRAPPWGYHTHPITPRVGPELKHASAFDPRLPPHVSTPRWPGSSSTVSITWPSSSGSGLAPLHVGVCVLDDDRKHFCSSRSAGTATGRTRTSLPALTRGWNADGSRCLSLCHVEARRVESSPLLLLVSLADHNERITGVITRVATDRVFPDGSLIAGLRVSKAMTATLAKHMDRRYLLIPIVRPLIRERWKIK